MFEAVHAYDEKKECNHKSENTAEKILAGYDIMGKVAVQAYATTPPCQADG